MDINPTPSWQQLIDWVEGKLSPADAARIEQQVAGADDKTRADVAWIRAFLRVGDAIVLDEPPAELRSTLRASFDAYADRKVAERERDDSPSLLNRLVAALTFDSGLQLGLAVARGSEIDGMRQLIYTTDLLELSLNIQHRPDGVRIDGQILPVNDLALDAFFARLELQAQPMAETAVDAYGLFLFTAIQPGAYQLSLESDTVSVRIEALDLHG